MDETWYAARAQLRALLTDIPVERAQYAERIKMSVAWVKKWRSRFRAARARPMIRFCGAIPRPKITAPAHASADHRTHHRDAPQSAGKSAARARSQSAAILSGPRPRAGQEQQVRPLRSTRRIWQILRQTGCIAAVRSRTPNPRPLAQPYTEFEMDFVDVVTVNVQPDGKRQHMVEILNIVDAGTSLLVATVARDDYSMATSIETLADIFRAEGVLPYLRLDRDPRFVGSQNSHDFPSAFMRFLHSLGVTIDLCPPAPARPKAVRNGVITNDKFCMSRLTHVHYPRSSPSLFSHMPAFWHHC